MRKIFLAKMNKYNIIQLFKFKNMKNSKCEYINIRKAQLRFESIHITNNT